MPLQKSILFIFIFFLNITNVFSMNVEEAISLAIENSTEVKIESKKAELSGVSKIDAAANFLPSLNLNYRDGTRKTRINNGDPSKQDDLDQTFNFSQPLFTGFSGVSKVAQSNYETKSAGHDLAFKKNKIAQQIVEIYSSILKYRQIIKIDQELISDYQKLVKLASQRLSLQDIAFDEFSDYELKLRRNQVDANQDKIDLGEYEAKFFNLTNHKPEAMEDPEIEHINYNLDDLINIANNQNPKIKATTLNYKAKKAAVAAESGKLLPKVTFNLQYENQKSSYILNNQGFINRSAYINVAVPIFQAGVEYSSIIKANKERQIADLEKIFARQEIEKEINVEYQKYLILKEDLSELEQSFNTHFKALELAKERFNKKDIGLMDYLVKKISAAETKRQLITTNSNLIITYYNLKSLINEIVSKN